VNPIAIGVGDGGGVVVVFLLCPLAVEPSSLLDVGRNGLGPFSFFFEKLPSSFSDQ